MIEIDGSQGEGGGQVLRSALALALLTQQAFHITSIRANRPKPGLMTQHLKAVQAAAVIGRPAVEGASLNSTELSFQPYGINAGRYHFDISTAGSSCLLLQTIFIPLCLAGAPSTISLTGGTHVPYSPSFHYLDMQWLPYLRKMGCEAKLMLEQAGFYPQGGGRLTVTIRPVNHISPLHILPRGALLRIRGISGVANLALDIARRQKHQALRRLEPYCHDTKIQTIEMHSPSKGTFICLLAEFENSQCCYSALGERGKPAERVADEMVDGLEAFLDTQASIDFYLADQLLLPMALARGISQFRTPRITQHLVTNAQVIQQFSPVKIEIQGELGEEGSVLVKT